VPRAQPPPRFEPSLRSCDAHSYPHEAFSNLCGDQERSASRGASPLRHCDRRSRHDAPQATPSASGGGFLFTALRSPAAWSSSATYWLGGGGSLPWSQEWTKWHDRRPRHDRWFPMAICLQPVDWHHPHVAWAVRGCLGPSPRHPSVGLLCRSTSGSALGTSLASAGAPSPSGASDPPCVGALDKWVGHAVSR
jgi:hypothetical protein